MRTFSTSLALGLLLTTMGCADKGADDGNGNGNSGPGDDSGGAGTTDEPDDPLMVDNDGDGFSEHRGDCNDDDPDIYPRAIERCNGVDDDCDTKIDDDDIDVYGQPAWWIDGDGDGYGNELQQIYACDDPGGYADNPLDCDDGDAALNPETVWYIDTDFDGYGSDAVTRTACEQPGGYAAAADDCNDSNDEINPAADEICDELDNDCDGDIDDDDSLVVDAENGVVFFEDADGDGYGVVSETTALGCETAPDGFSGTVDDCDDTDATINPGATEIWYDGVDQDCGVDNDYDADADGYDSIDHSGDDCDDEEELVNPGMSEVCNDGIDNDCSGDAPECVYEIDDSALGAYLSGDSASSGIGHAFDVAGDVDGDGVHDMIVGDNSASGAYILFGPVSGTHTVSSLSDAWVEDTSGGSAGDAVATVPDLDGDGYDELLIGCETCDPLTAGDTYGAAWLVHGPVTSGWSGDLSTADAIWRGSSSSGAFGGTLHTSTDFDADGTYDVLLGEPGASTAYMVLGTVTASGEAASAATATFTGDGVDELGAAVADGDLNGDGSVDYIIGAPNYDAGFLGATGAVYVVYGPQSGTVDVTTSYDAMLSYASSTTAGYGRSVHAGGDVDGDGAVDLAVGAPDYNTGEGMAYVHFGALSGVIDAAAADINFSYDGFYASGLGTGVHIGGDVDQDGSTDVVITAASSSQGTMGTYVFLGPVSSSSYLVTGASDFYGESVSLGDGSQVRIGDPNNDGFDDIVVGVPSSSSYEGGIHLFGGRGM
jgi:hypothetical protein